MNPFMIPLAGILAGVIITIGLPLVRAFARKVELEAQQPRIPAEVAARLERMEQAIDGIAIEIERVAEAQRFTARLLAEQGPRAAALPRDANAGVQGGADAR